VRVLQVITDTDRRGAQVFATDLHPALERRGHEVTTVALAPGSSDDPLPVPVLGATRRELSTIRSLRRLARDADVVAAHGSTTLQACTIATPGTGTPFVYRQISDSLFWAPSAARRLVVRACLSRAAAVTALSTSSAAVLRESFGVPAHRLAVIPNAIPTVAFAPGTADEGRAARAHFDLDENAFVVLSISALVPEKGVDLVIDAVVAESGRRARTSNDEQASDRMHLLVVGAGPELDALQRRALSGPEGLVSFVGSLPAARPAYLAADVVVLASRGGDSMPATLIEAASCGRPSISTPVGAIAEIVLDGRTGLIVAVDDTAGLQQALADLRDDPERRERLGASAREHVLTRFDIDVVAAAWDTTLSSAGDRHGDRGHE
jgi:glycosyltransferase involved in cell wall biosynthesis